jgi:hypothetical protein
MSAKAKGPVTSCVVQPQPAGHVDHGALVTATNSNGSGLALSSK